MSLPNIRLSLLLQSSPKVLTILRLSSFLNLELGPVGSLVSPLFCAQANYLMLSQILSARLTYVYDPSGLTNARANLSDLTNSYLQPIAINLQQDYFPTHSSILQSRGRVFSIRGTFYMYKKNYSNALRELAFFKKFRPRGLRQFFFKFSSSMSTFGLSTSSALGVLMAILGGFNSKLLSSLLLRGLVLINFKPLRLANSSLLYGDLITLSLSLSLVQLLLSWQRQQEVSLARIRSKLAKSLRQYSLSKVDKLTSALSGSYSLLPTWIEPDYASLSFFFLEKDSQSVPQANFNPVLYRLLSFR